MTVRASKLQCTTVFSFMLHKMILYSQSQLLWLCVLLFRLKYQATLKVLQLLIFSSQWK